MRDRRIYIVFAFFAWWTVWGMLLNGIPFKIGAAKMYSPTEGMGPSPYVNHDIKNVQRFSMMDFVSFFLGNQPSRGVKGTTFDQVNKARDIPPIAVAIQSITRFGSPEMVESMYGPINPQKVSLPDPATVTKFIKDFCKYFGAVDVGIAEMDPRPELWFFEDDSFGFQYKFKPEEHKYAIVILNEEKQASHPFPRELNTDTLKYYSKVGKGYWDDDYISGQLAEFIRLLGYQAWGHNNSFTRNVPLAIKAGLGEYGRFGNVITANWGGNVRIASVTTNLPLVADQPVDLGIRDFCSMCTRCYDYCPTRAIPMEEMEFMGVNKWTLNFWRCRRSTVVGLDKDFDACTCTVCRDVCPFVKDTKYLGNKIGRVMVTRSHIGRRFLLNLDYVLYTKWDKHNLGQITTDRRTRLKEASRQYPEGDWSKDWFTTGAKDPAGRRIYREKNSWGNLAVAVQGVGDVYPFFTKEDMADPTFCNWPTWTDPFGRTIKGYEYGQRGAPRLDLRSVVKLVGSSALSGVGSSAMTKYVPLLLEPEKKKAFADKVKIKLPPDLPHITHEQALQMPVDTFPGAGYDTACNPWSGSYH